MTKPVDDDLLLREVASMRDVALSRVAAMPDGFLEIDDPVIIKAAWGARVTTSRSRGMHLTAYPEKVGASKALWLHSIANPDPRVKVVIAKKKAQARIDAALAHIRLNPEDQQPEPQTAITQEEIDDMLAERAELRAQRQFADADKIRDYLVAHGVAVSDAKVAL